MNKVAAAVLAVAMVGSMAVPAFATSKTGNEANNYTTQDSTTVKYQVTAEYEWNIHSAIDFGADKGDKNVQVAMEVVNGDENNKNTVSVTKNVIPNDKKLRITVKGSGDSEAFTIKTDEGATLNYTVKVGAKGSALAVGGTVMDVASGTYSDSKDMVFTLTTDVVEKAGTYNGTVTYSAALVDVNTK